MTKRLLNVAHIYFFSTTKFRNVCCNKIDFKNILINDPDQFKTQSLTKKKKSINILTS